MTHVAGASSEERRTRLFGKCIFQADQGTRGGLGRRAARRHEGHARGFRPRGTGRATFPIPLDEMIHGAAVTEAIIRSAETHLPEKVG